MNRVAPVRRSPVKRDVLRDWVPIPPRSWASESPPADHTLCPTLGKDLPAITRPILPLCSALSMLFALHQSGFDRAQAPQRAGRRASGPLPCARPSGMDNASAQLQNFQLCDGRDARHIAL